MDVKTPKPPNESAASAELSKRGARTRCTTLETVTEARASVALDGETRVCEPEQEALAAQDEALRDACHTKAKSPSSR